MSMPAVDPEITEELPLTPEYRAVLDAHSRFLRGRAIGLSVLAIVTVVGGVVVNALLIEREWWWAGALCTAALALLLVAGTIYVAWPLRQRAGMRTFARSSGVLRLSFSPPGDTDSVSSGPVYTLHVGWRPLPFPGDDDALGIPVYDHRGRLHDVKAGRVRGTVDHATDGSLIFAVRDTSGRLLYQRPPMATGRRPRARQ